MLIVPSPAWAQTVSCLPPSLPPSPSSLHSAVTTCMICVPRSLAAMQQPWEAERVSKACYFPVFALCNFDGIHSSSERLAGLTGPLFWKLKVRLDGASSMKLELKLTLMKIRSLMLSIENTVQYAWLSWHAVYLEIKIFHLNISM